MLSLFQNDLPSKKPLGLLQEPFFQRSILLTYGFCESLEFGALLGVEVGGNFHVGTNEQITP